jgi:hypothetical protein
MQGPNRCPEIHSEQPTTVCLAQRRKNNILRYHFFRNFASLLVSVAILLTPQLFDIN